MQNYSINLIDKIQQVQAIIVANGQLCVDNYIQQLFNQSLPIICCDGAINTLEQLNIIPTIIIGDGDSITPDLRIKYQDKFIWIKEQQTNDLTKAIHFCQQQQYQSVVILGATGKREDHCLANISLLIEYQQMIAEVYMLTAYGIFIASNKPISLTTKIGQQISIFSFNAGKIDSSGLQYPLQQTKLDTLWAGSLNQAITTQIHLNFKQGSLLIYLANEIKK